jgi:hypothetical protein
MSKQKRKLKRFRFFGFNVKLYSLERKGESIYAELIQNIFRQDILVSIGAERAMTLRTQFTASATNQDLRHQIFYGKLLRFTLLEGNNWYSKTKHDFINYEVPLDAFPNAFETDYIFIPAVHRFFIKISSKINANITREFLEKAFSRVALSNEQVTVNVIQSKDIIDQIISSDDLRSLKVNVSYTNDDIGDEAQELIDKLLKDGQIGEAEASFRPDQNGNLSTKSSLIRGLLEIAKDNGRAEATIINENGKRQKIKTTNYPEKINIDSESEESIKIALFEKMMKEHRDDVKTEDTN